MLIDGLCDLIYPSNCLICKTYIPDHHSNQVLCPACVSRIEENHPPFCAKCSRSLGTHLKRTLCQECKIQDYHFDRAWAATLYNKPMQELIHLFKYQSKTLLRKEFTRLIFSFLKRYHIDLSKINTVVPIPLHPARMRERGFNQAELLSRAVCQEFSLTQSTKNFIRRKHTPNQALLSKKERWTNCRGAFKINDPLEFRDKNVLLIDDLYTTGATVSEAARLLKEAGAKVVDVFTLSIAMPYENH